MNANNLRASIPPHPEERDPYPAITSGETIGPINFNHLDLNKAINYLVYGTKAHIVTKNKKKPYVFFISEHSLNELHWTSLTKDKTEKADLSLISSVGSFAAARGKRSRFDVSNMLRILYGKDKELILYFDDTEQREHFWCGLKHFVDKVGQEEEKGADMHLILSKKMLKRSDSYKNSKKKVLSKKELTDMVKSFGIGTAGQNLEELAAQFNLNKTNGEFDQAEFLKFLKHLVKKKEVLPLFQEYASNINPIEHKDSTMTLVDLERFFSNVQKEERSIESLKALLPENLKDVDPKEPCITFDMFCYIIFSPTNSIFNQKYLHEYQEMTRPLSDYYINSSHNTYLMSNQLTGVSSTQAYINALKRGCRCVELDLWDGPNKEPIIYHGHTMTSKIFFEDVIKVLKENAFVSNPYPLILSFEMHCGLKAQKKIHDILKREIGDMMFSVPPDFEKYVYYPSPAALKYKFIIKCKGHLQFSENVDCDEYRDLQADHVENIQKIFRPLRGSADEGYCAPTCENVDSEEYRDLNSMHTHNIRKVIRPIGSGTNDFKASRAKTIAETKGHRKVRPLLRPCHGDHEKSIDFYDFEERGSGLSLGKASEKTTEGTPLRGRWELDGNNKARDYSGPKKVVRKKSTKKNKPTKAGGISSLNDLDKEEEKHKKKKKIHPELNLLYGLIGRKFDLAKFSSVWEIASLKEEKFESIFKTKYKELMDFHKKIISRIYPSNLRVSSSNYCPIKGWAAGVQLVALNFQSNDEPMLLNTAKFRANGGSKCGYVLKPYFMLHDYPPKPKDGKKNGGLKGPNKIISGQAQSAYGHDVSPKDDKLSRKGTQKEDTLQIVGAQAQSAFLRDILPKEEEQIGHPLDRKAAVKRVSIKIISAQALRSQEENSKRVLNPFVEVKIKGLEPDEKHNQVNRTQTIPNNGFHPIWASEEHPCEFHFKIFAPEFCSVIFTVYTEDRLGKYRLGWYAIEINNMQQGYRVVPLFDNELRLMQHTYIFSHITIKDM